MYEEIPKEAMPRLMQISNRAKSDPPPWLKPAQSSEIYYFLARTHIRYAQEIKLFGQDFRPLLDSVRILRDLGRERRKEKGTKK